jgi:glycosyltransferase involved in cell wall biosynthesis
MPTIPRKPSVLNLGVTRYSHPLSPTHRLKFEKLGEIADFHVVGLSSSLRPRSFQEHARFTLVPRLPFAGLRFLSAMAVGAVIGLARPFDVILCESPYEGGVGVLLRGALGVLCRRAAVITELHGEWEESPFLYRKIRLRFLLAPLIAAWTRFALRRSDLLRAVSRDLKAKAEERGSAPVAALFPTFTDFDMFLDSRAREPNDPPSILYVGGLYPIKGVDVLAKAFSTLLREGVRAQLVVLGEGPYRDGLDAPGLLASVSLRGAVPPSVVREEMLRARALVLPSLSEGLPRVIMEAMACSLPVVASAVGGIPELVEDGATGFMVPPGDSDALARRLRQVLEDEPGARAMGARGREKAERELSSHRYFEGYRQLLGSARDLLTSR